MASKTNKNTNKFLWLGGVILVALGLLLVGMYGNSLKTQLVTGSEQCLPSGERDSLKQLRDGYVSVVEAYTQSLAGLRANLAVLERNLANLESDPPSPAKGKQVDELRMQIQNLKSQISGQEGAKLNNEKSIMQIDKRLDLDDCDPGIGGPGQPPSNVPSVPCSTLDDKKAARDQIELLKQRQVDNNVLMASYQREYDEVNAERLRLMSRDSNAGQIRFLDQKLVSLQAAISRLRLDLAEIPKTMAEKYTTLSLPNC